MVLVKINANPTLKGHTLLLFNPFGTPQSYIDRLHAEFSDLKIISRDTEPNKPAQPHDIASDEEWKDVTILLAFSGFPDPKTAPKIEVVQLLSAGANHVLDKPLFKDTDVTFCTANGVHG